MQLGYVVKFLSEEVKKMSFSEKLQNLRKEKKYSQEELADLLDVTRQSVSKWESGQTYPEMDKLLSLCKIFNCTLDELTNDEVKEITSEKRTGFKSIIDSILELVTKTYNMITNMSFKELSRCIFLMLIVAFILSLFNHPLNYFEYKLYGLFVSFGSVKAASVLSTMFNLLLDTTYFIIVILLFVHIFKIGFLDKYEFVPKASDNKKKEETRNNDYSDKEIVKERKEIIKEEKIIREFKTPNYAFFEALGKLSMFFVKIILIFFAVPFIAIFFCLFGALVVDLYLIITGIKYFSIPIIIIFSILLNILAIEFIANIIFNKKNKYKRMIILFLLGIAGLGVGSGILLLDIHKTEVINKLPSEIKIVNNAYEYTYEEGIFFEHWGNIEYIVDNNLKNKIHININSHEGLNNINIDRLENGYHINSYNVNPSYIMNFIDIIIDGLKDNKVYNFYAYDDMKMTITSSESTINNLKSNLNKYYESERYAEDRYNTYRNEIDNLYNKIANLEEQLYELEEQNSNLTEEKAELKIQLEEYKEKIKSLIE